MLATSLWNHMYGFTQSWKRKQGKHLTQERGDIYHVCEKGANDWASNHTPTIDIDSGWNYIGKCTTPF